MALHRIKKGLDLPITGAPQQTLEVAEPPTQVAVVASDYHGMKPTMHVQVGDRVQRGQPLFEDKKTPGVFYTAPGGGKVTAVNRGERRALQSIVIDLDDDERAGKSAAVRFKADTGKDPADLDRTEVRDLLVESGLWTALRTRPFSKVADPQTTPKSIFVTAIDTNPLAPEVGVVIEGRGDDFERGLVALSKLTDGTVFVCKAPGTNLQMPGDQRVRVEEFTGPHPAGTVGLHIHMLDAVDRGKLVWHVGYQDLLAIGCLFDGGDLDVTRVVSLAGPPVKNPRLLRTRIGASLDDLILQELEEGEMRVISGSVLAGRKAQGEVHGYLGRYDNQVSVLREGREREFLGWLAPGSNKFSVLNTYVSKFMPGKKFALTTDTNGSDRAIVPIGSYERVFPMDILPTFMMRSLVMGDFERAMELGILELDEEDVALCSFVCPGKNDYGFYLRDLLNEIEKDG
jgi:Na+-transporting NADH:ubiquinone oxidoreductase subunit A